MEICNKVTSWNKTMGKLKTSSSERRFKQSVTPANRVKQLTRKPSVQTARTEVNKNEFSKAEKSD
jgi:hypothetical protein